MKVTVLAGGVGGAKGVDGLSRLLPPGQLTAVVNTGDDFEHLGLWICPDLDTVCYTLAGLANPETGWGRAGETWTVHERLIELGGPGWFRLGDRDLATHLERTRRLRSGASLTEVTASFCRAWGVGPDVLPMSDDPAPTIVCTTEGDLAFQEYFVHRRCEPAVTGFRFEGSRRPAPGVIEAIETADLVVISPSNPWVSVDPIRSVVGVSDALKRRPVVGISPIIGGEAVKGPAAKMYAEMGIRPSAAAAAAHYVEFLDGFVIDSRDAGLTAEITECGIQVHVTETWMKTQDDRVQLAAEVLAFGRSVMESIERTP